MVQSPWTAHDRAIARNTGTAGCICFINFAHCVKVHNNICLVNTKFNTLSYLVTRYRFWGPRRFTWFGALSQHNYAPPCQHSLRMSTLILTVSYVYIYIQFMYVCIYIQYIYKHIRSIHQWFHGDSQSPWRHRSATPISKKHLPVIPTVWMRQLPRHQLT